MSVQDVLVACCGLPCDPPIVDGVPFSPHPEDPNLWIGRGDEAWAVGVTRIPQFQRFSGSLEPLAQVPPAVVTTPPPEVPAGPLSDLSDGPTPPADGAGGPPDGASSTPSGDVPPAGETTTGGESQEGTTGGEAPPAGDKYDLAKPVFSWTNASLLAFADDHKDKLVVPAEFDRKAYSAAITAFLKSED